VGTEAKQAWPLQQGPVAGVPVKGNMTRLDDDGFQPALDQSPRRSFQSFYAPWSLEIHAREVSMQWRFDLLIPAQLAQFATFVNPRMATLTTGSSKVEKETPSTRGSRKVWEAR
jgi:hypothetical protein